jgi:ankyrin repeat protein
VDFSTAVYFFGLLAFDLSGRRMRDAAAAGNVPLLLTLLAHGATVETRGGLAGDTPLHAAARAGQLDACR